MSQTEIRVAGFGGQGVILCGMIVGRAACIFDNKYATLTQSFGPEARGGACSAQVIVADEPILYPYVTHPDIMVIMSQAAADKFVPTLRPGARLLIEEDLVHIGKTPEGVTVYGIPSTRLAEELGRKIVQNIVMVGYLSAVTKILPKAAMRDSVAASVPSGTEDFNLIAFEKGYEHGEVALAELAGVD